MKDLKNVISERTKQAMRDKNSALLNTLRNINSKITEYEKSSAGKVASDDDIIKIIEKLSKQREEAIKLYKQGSREDLVAIEEFEFNVLKEYLPQKLNEDQTREIIKNLYESGTSTIGEYMKALSAYGNNVDKKLASEIIKEFLG